MPPVKKPKPQFRKTFLKEWREYRGLTQEQASDRLDMDRSNLSRVERGQIPYSQGLLEAASIAYMCEPWELLNVNPLKEGAVVDLTHQIARADPDVQRQISEFAKFLLRGKQAS